MCHNTVLHPRLMLHCYLIGSVFVLTCFGLLEQAIPNLIYYKSINGIVNTAASDVRVAIPLMVCGSASNSSSARNKAVYKLKRWMALQTNRMRNVRSQILPLYMELIPSHIVHLCRVQRFSLLLRSESSFSVSKFYHTVRFMNRIEGAKY